MSALLDFHFLRPLWLLGLAPLLGAYPALRRARSLSPAWARLISPRLLARLVVHRKDAAGLRPLTLLLSAGILAFIAMAGPAWDPEPKPDGPDDTAMLVVLEAGATMDGTDMGPSRLGRAKLKVRDLIETGQVGRLGLLTYAGTAHTVMPLTSDQEIILPYLDALAVDLMPQPGDAAETVVPLLEKTKKGIDTPLTVVLVSDGVTPAAAKAWAAFGKQPGVQLVIWSVGTTSGVPAQNIPPLDTTGFEQMEREGGATTVSLAVGKSDLRTILRLLRRNHRSSLRPDDAAAWKDNGYYLVFPLALLVLFWFRRGFVLRMGGAMTALLLLIGCGETTAADLLFTRDQQGRWYFEHQQFETAAERFEDPMWKGLAYYTAQNWQGAIESFGQIQTPEGYFNLGNAYAQARQYITAVAAYDRALKLRPTYREARSNRDLWQDYIGKMQESSDAEESTKPMEQSNEASRKLREDQKNEKAETMTSDEKKELEKKGAVTALSGTMDEAWMRRVTTRPEDFLRAKFAAQKQEVHP